MSFVSSLIQHGCLGYCRADFLPVKCYSRRLHEEGAVPSAVSELIEDSMDCDDQLNYEL